MSDLLDSSLITEALHSLGVHFPSVWVGAGVRAEHVPVPGVPGTSDGLPSGSVEEEAWSVQWSEVGRRAEEGMRIGHRTVLRSGVCVNV